MFLKMEVIHGCDTYLQSCAGCRIVGASRTVAAQVSGVCLMPEGLLGRGCREGAAAKEDDDGARDSHDGMQ